MKVFCRSSYRTYKVFKESISILIWIFSNNSTVSYIFKVRTNVVVHTIQGICFTHTDLSQVELNLDATLDPYVLREENMQRYPKYLEDKTNFCLYFFSCEFAKSSAVYLFWATSISSRIIPTKDHPNCHFYNFRYTYTYTLYLSLYTSIVFLLEIQQISEYKYIFISREFGFYIKIIRNDVRSIVRSFEIW